MAEIIMTGQVVVYHKDLVKDIAGPAAKPDEVPGNRMIRGVDKVDGYPIIVFEADLVPMGRYKEGDKEIVWSFQKTFNWAHERDLELYFEIGEKRDPFEYVYCTKAPHQISLAGPSSGSPDFRQPRQRGVKTGRIEFKTTATPSITDHLEVLGKTLVGMSARSATIESIQDPIEAEGDDVMDVRLARTRVPVTNDLALWVAIRQRTNAISFNEYRDFIDDVFCVSDPKDPRTKAQTNKRLRERPLRPSDNFSNMYMSNIDAYNLLKVATDAFLLCFGCGELEIDEHQYSLDKDFEAIRMNNTLEFDQVRDRLNQYLVGGEGGRLPYLDRILNTLSTMRVFNLPARRHRDDNGSGDNTDAGDVLKEMTLGEEECVERIQPKEDLCMIELIWSYWHEEGMLVQTMNAITMRFQNRRASKHDPLANLELDPLRPLNNFIWGFIQDEKQRLSVTRRVYEYDHHYGLKLIGKAVPKVRSADSRSKFIETFHNLLYLTAIFYQEDDETTVHADAYRLLKALIDLHLILAEGAHNQYGDLPWTARAEMLAMGWILQRREMNEFLRGRYMVPHQEPWMGPVSAMRKLQDWGDTPIKHFRDLAIFGEQLLLSIRFGDWIDVIIQEQAKNWARYWRPEIQGYLYAYQAVTGVDLAADQTTVRADVRYAQPAALMNRRLPQRDTDHEKAMQKRDSARRKPSEIRSNGRD